MPWSLGTFSRIYNFVTSVAGGTKVTAAMMDAELDGIAAGMNTCITKDGQIIPTANLPMNGYKHTGVANGSASTDYAAYGQLTARVPTAHSSDTTTFLRGDGTWEDELAGELSIAPTGEPNTEAILSVSGGVNYTSGTPAISIQADSVLGSTTDIYGLYSGVTSRTAAVTVANRVGLYVANATKGTGSTITNDKGIHVADVTQGNTAGGGLNIGAQLAVSSGTGKYNVYANGTAQNYFNGKVGVGVSAPSYTLDVLAGIAASHMFRIGNSDTSGYGSILFTDHSSTAKGTLGYGNSATSSPYTSSMFIDTAANVSLVLMTEGAEKLTLSGTENWITVVGASSRLRGDFSNGTTSTRTLLQSSTTNGETIVGAIPNGTGVNSGFAVYDNSDPDNGGYLYLSANTTENFLDNNKNGSGTARNFSIRMAGTDAITCTQAGSVVAGKQGAALGATATDGFLYIPTVAGTPSGVPTTQTGSVAICFDTTNNKIYVYDGGWLATAALT